MGKNFFEKPTLEGVEPIRKIIVFIGERYFLKTIFFWGGKFFCNAYFCKSLFEIDFFGEKIHDNGYFIKLLFQIDFLGKKIYDKLFALYRQKTPGTGRGGGSGPGMGEYLGGICPGKNEKAPGVCGNSLRRLVLASLTRRDFELTPD